MQAHNTKLRLQVNDLQMALKAKDKEIRQLRARIGNLEKIQEVVEIPGDVLNKARLFDNDVKSGRQVSAAEIIPVLVSFMMKMESTLGEMWKLLSGSLVAGSSQAPPPSPKEPLQEHKEFEEMKAYIQQHRTKEAIKEVAKITIPLVGVPATTLAAKGKKTEKDSETKTTNSGPTSQLRSGKKKAREPSSELEEEEESVEDTGSSGGNQSSEEEESATPPSDKRRKMDTRSLDKKKLNSSFKTLVAPKRPMKTPGKGGSSQKKPKGKQVESRQQINKVAVEIGLRIFTPQN